MTTAIDFANKLGSGVYQIEFNKLDGTLRRMRATRASAFIPAYKSPKSSIEVSETQRAVPAFDLDLMEWRSVIVDNIVTMESVD